MSKLDELINKLCPDGVEFKELSSLLDYKQPGPYIVKNTNYDDAGTPVLTAGQSFILGYTNESNGIYKATKEKPVIIFDDFTTSFHWVDFNFKVKSSAMKILFPRNGVNFRFVFHAMMNIKYIPAEHSRQWIAKYSQIKIPVPPIEVQREIVRILDSFTELQDTLDEEYSKRTQIYDSLSMTIFDNLYITHGLVRVSSVAKNQSIKNKGEICKDAFSITQSGLVRTSDFFKDAKVTSSDTSTYKIVKPGWFVYSPSRIDVGSIDYSKLEFDVIVTSLDVVFSVDENQIDKDYLLLFLLSKKGMFQILANRQGIEGTGRKTIAFENFGKVKMPLPSLSEQRVIVEKLSMLANYNKTLKLEIEKRKIQYEHYRDQLLSFKELSK